METKPIAKGDYTYCVNNKCNQSELCARYIDNYIFDDKRLYSFCNFNEDICQFKEN